MQSPHTSSSKGTVQTIKAGTVGELAPTDLFFFDAANVNAADVWLQFFDQKLATDITLGSTVPNLKFCIPAGDATNTGGRCEHFSPPLKFRKGCHYAFTTTPTGATAPSSNVEMNGGFG
jgi:hypothetical protein